MVLTVERQRGNATLVNGHLVVNRGAYAPEVPTAPDTSIYLTANSPVTDLPYACVPGDELNQEEAETVLEVRAGAALRAAEILNARGWSAYRVGNTSAATAFWEAASIVDDVFGPERDLDRDQASSADDIGGLPLGCLADANMSDAVTSSVRFLRAGAALQAGAILTERAWARYKVGDTAAFSAFQEAAALLEREFTDDVAEIADVLLRDLWA